MHGGQGKCGLTGEISKMGQEKKDRTGRGALVRAGGDRLGGRGCASGRATEAGQPAFRAGQRLVGPRGFHPFPSCFGPFVSLFFLSFFLGGVLKCMYVPSIIVQYMPSACITNSACA